MFPQKNPLITSVCHGCIIRRQSDAEIAKLPTEQLRNFAAGLPANTDIKVVYDKETDALLTESPYGQLMAFTLPPGYPGLPTNRFYGFDLISNPWAMVEDVAAGTVLIADDGFTCVAPGTALVVRCDARGLWVECGDGQHYLDGQTFGIPGISTGADFYIGLTLRDKVVGYFNGPEAEGDDNLPIYLGKHAPDPYVALPDGNYYTVDADGDIDLLLDAIPAPGTPILSELAPAGRTPVLGPMLTMLISDLFNAGPASNRPFPVEMFEKLFYAYTGRIQVTGPLADRMLVRLKDRLVNGRLDTSDFDFIVTGMMGLEIDVVTLHGRNTVSGTEMEAMVVSDRVMQQQAAPQQMLEQIAKIREANPQSFDDWVTTFITTLRALQIEVPDEPSIAVNTGRIALMRQRDKENELGANLGDTELPRTAAAEVARLIAEDIAMAHGQAPQRRT